MQCSRQVWLRMDGARSWFNVSVTVEPSSVPPPVKRRRKKSPLDATPRPPLSTTAGVRDYLVGSDLPLDRAVSFVLSKRTEAGDLCVCVSG